MNINSITKYLFSGILILSGTYPVSGQSDSLKTVILNSVDITGKKPTFQLLTRQVSAMTGLVMQESGSQTLSQALSDLPGVSQLTTGAISKPVIRGLYGNRIVVNMAGIKIEDQQWEDEYGLDLSGTGIERVELIKGPASLLYGSGAMGGVVNIVEDDFQDPGRKNHDLNLRLFSNTFGAGLDYGYRHSGRNTFILRAGMDSHADYSDGSGKRVPNTRFAIYNLKGGYIIDRSHFRSENRLHLSFNQFGFIADSADLAESEVEPRLSREFEEAHQQVLTTLLSSINTYRPDETTEWKVTLGLQNNIRNEQERSETENLALSLTTGSFNTSLKKQLSSSLSWTNGISGMIQVNTNNGSRIIVPDATIAEGSFFSYLRHRYSTGNILFNSEGGIRYDYKRIATRETGTLNPPESTIPAFSRGMDDLTGSIGESITYGELLLKGDLSSGFRSGNLAELSANGLHEGTSFWYIGNPDMKPEKCLNLDLSASWQHNWLTVRGSVFSNWFSNYIYLQPTDELIGGYKIYRYDQTDATLKGFEAGLSAEQEGIFDITADYSFLSASRSDGSWLPLTPSNRILTNARYYFQKHPSTWQNLFLSFGVNYTFAQNNIDQFEDPTPGYWIVNAGAGLTIKSVRILLSCRNLTDQLYFDHLSRLKYYGLYDMGRNIVLNIGWQF
jgi:iron complex outermembrane recepter protein